MSTSLQCMLRGFGSILDIMPERGKNKRKIKLRFKNPEELMASSWIRVGKDIDEAIIRYDHGQKTVSGKKIQK